MDWLAELNILAYNIKYCTYLVIALLDKSVNTQLEIVQSFGYSCIKHNHGRSTVGLGTYSTELETVSGKGKW